MENFKFNDELLAVQDDLLRFAYKLTADKHKAEDLLQDTLLKALSNKEKYSTDTNFKGWVFIIMRNTFINNYRMERPLLYISSNPVLFSQIKDDSYLSEVDNRYDIKELHNALKSIPKEHYTSFGMYIAGYKYREIAEATGVAIGTVKSRIFHCRKKLKALLGE